jgi:hypothetical protein
MSIKWERNTTLGRFTKSNRTTKKYQNKEVGINLFKRILVSHKTIRYDLTSNR